MAFPVAYEKEQICRACAGSGEGMSAWGHLEDCWMCRGSGFERPARIEKSANSAIARRLAVEAIEKYVLKRHA